MNENKGRFPWKDGANFEAVDPDGRVFQIIQRPYYKFGQWRPFEGWFVGNSDIPQDASTTLIERYPSEQEQPTSQPDPALDFDETPFMPNRAEAWVRFMAASIARENIRNIDEAASFADRALAEYGKRFLNQ